MKDVKGFKGIRLIIRDIIKGYFMLKTNLRYTLQGFEEWNGEWPAGIVPKADEFGNGICKAFEK